MDCMCPTGVTAWAALKRGQLVCPSAPTAPCFPNPCRLLAPSPSFHPLCTRTRPAPRTLSPGVPWCPPVSPGVPRRVPSPPRPATSRAGGAGAEHRSSGACCQLLRTRPSAPGQPRARGAACRLTDTGRFSRRGGGFSPLLFSPALPLLAEGVCSRHSSRGSTFWGHLPFTHPVVTHSAVTRPVDTRPGVTRPAVTRYVVTCPVVAHPRVTSHSLLSSLAHLQPLKVASTGPSPGLRRVLSRRRRSNAQARSLAGGADPAHREGRGFRGDPSRGARAGCITWRPRVPWSGLCRCPGAAAAARCRQCFAPCDICGTAVLLSH